MTVNHGVPNSNFLGESSYDFPSKEIIVILILSIYFLLATNNQDSELPLLDQPNITVIDKQAKQQEIYLKNSSPYQSKHLNSFKQNPLLLQNSNLSAFKLLYSVLIYTNFPRAL